jgi:hypothetical protein
LLLLATVVTIGERCSDQAENESHFPLPFLVGNMSSQNPSNPYAGTAGVAAQKTNMPARTNGLAVASLVLGGLSLIFSCLTGLFGLILGIVALVQIGGSNGAQKGKGLAITGMLLSFMLSIIVPLAMLLPAVSAVRHASKRVMTLNNARMLQLAQLNYESTHMRFPGNDNGLSWRVHILPFIEYQDLYDQFNLDEPWDSPTNFALLDQMPECFKSPAGEELPPGKTRFLRPVGNGAAPLPGEGEGEDQASFSFGMLTGGSSNTFAIVEVDSDYAVNWTQPSDYNFDPESPMAGLGNAQTTGGFVVAGYDGSVMYLEPDVDPNAIKSGMTFHSDGDPPRRF